MRLIKNFFLFDNMLHYLINKLEEERFIKKNRCIKFLIIIPVNNLTINRSFQKRMREANEISSLVSIKLQIYILESV